MGTDGSGFAAYAAYADLPQILYKPLNTNAGVITWAGGTVQQMTGYSNFGTLAALNRVVGWGLRITGELALTSASGHVWIATVPSDYYSNANGLSFLPNSESDFQSTPLARKIPLSEFSVNPLSIAGQAFDDGIFRFRDEAAPNAAANQIESSNGWGIIAIMIVGGVASVNTLTLEVITHLEYIVNPKAGYFIDAQAGRYNMLENQVIENVAKVLPFAEKDDEEFDTVGFLEKVARNSQRVATSAATIIGTTMQFASGFNRARHALMGNGRVGGNNFVQAIQYWSIWLPRHPVC